MNEKKRPTDSEMFQQNKEQLHIQMLSSVSHDLKTPLASVIGSLEIYKRMKDKLSEDKKEQLILNALQEAYRLDRFITNILDMNRLESKMVSLNTRDTNIHTLLKDCQIKLSSLSDKNPFEIQGDKGLNVMLDDSLLLKALSSLIENAYIHSRTQACKIVVSFQKTGRTLSFLVQDNGQGIPSDKQDKIFEKYTRYVQQDHKNAGTGLGLPIAQAVVRLMKGEITLKPTTQGACFEIAIPV